MASSLVHRVLEPDNKIWQCRDSIILGEINMPIHPWGNSETLHWPTVVSELVNIHLLSQNQKSNLYTFAWFFISQIGQSLVMLRVSHGLASSVTSIPVDALQPLTSLQHLDLSNSRIRSMPENSFHPLKHLQVLNLQDNQIDNIYKGTFQVTSCTFWGGGGRRKGVKICNSAMTLKLLSEKRYCYIFICWIYGAKCGYNSFFVFRLLSINAPLCLFIILLKSFKILAFYDSYLSYSGDCV